MRTESWPTNSSRPTIAACGCAGHGKFATLFQRKDTDAKNLAAALNWLAPEGCPDCKKPFAVLEVEIVAKGKGKSSDVTAPKTPDTPVTPTAS